MVEHDEKELQALAKRFKIAKNTDITLSLDSVCAALRVKIRDRAVKVLFV